MFVCVILVCVIQLDCVTKVANGRFDKEGSSKDSHQNSELISVRLRNKQKHILRIQKVRNAASTDAASSEGQKKSWSSYASSYKVADPNHCEINEILKLFNKENHSKWHALIGSSATVSVYWSYDFHNFQIANDK